MLADSSMRQLQSADFVDSFRHSKDIKPYSITIVALTIVMLFLFTSCGKKKSPTTAAIINRDSVPVMVTYGVSTYVSDSGVVRYKIITDEWKVYDKLTPSVWSFEQGIYLEKFDNDLNVDATIIADTAYYYDQQEIWELRGNVHIENLQDEQFDTQLLFWNQKTKKVYSDLYIRIRQQKRIITGIGFISNQEFTDYTIKQTQGIFPIKEEKVSSTDSTTVAIEDEAIENDTMSDARTVLDEEGTITKEPSKLINNKTRTTKEKSAEDGNKKLNVNEKNINIDDSRLVIKDEKLIIREER